MTAVHVQSWRNVDQAQFFDALCMVQRQAVRHATAPVVATHERRCHTQRVEQTDHFLGHRTFAVVLRISCGIR